MHIAQMFFQSPLFFAFIRAIRTFEVGFLLAIRAHMSSQIVDVNKIPLAFMAFKGEILLIEHRFLKNVLIIRRENFITFHMDMIP